MYERLGNTFQDFHTLREYIEKEYSKCNIQIISNIKDEINWEIILKNELSDEENISVNSSYDDGIIIFYSYMHWHIYKSDIFVTEEIDYIDDYGLIIKTLNEIIIDKECIYDCYRDYGFSDWAETGAKNLKDDVFLRKILSNCEMPFKKKIKSIKIKQWDKRERKFKRLKNNFWEEI